MYKQVIQLQNGYLAILCYDEDEINIWDYEKTEIVSTIELFDNPKLMLQIDSGELIVTTYDNIHVYNLTTQNLIYTMKGHGDVMHLSQLKNGNLLTHSWSHSSIKIWNLKNKTCIATHETHHLNKVKQFVELKNGNIISTEMRDYRIKVWDLNPKDVIATLIGHIELITSMLELNNGNLVTGSFDNTIKIWDMNSTKCIASLNTDVVEGLFQLKNGDLVSVSRHKTIKLWNLKTNTCIGTLKKPHTHFVYNTPVRLVELQNGYLASVSMDETINIWDIKAKALIATLGHRNYINELFQLKNGDLISSSGSEILIWKQI